MTRNIETIVAAHRISQERLRQGLPSWKHTVNFAGLIRNVADDPGAEVLAATIHSVAAKLRTDLPSAYFDITHNDYERELDDIVEEMEAISAQDEDVEGDCNALLEQLYEWADVNRVWLRA